MAILLKGCKPDNFQSHSSLKLSFTNNWCLFLNFVEYESFLESNSPGIYALCETNSDDSVDSGRQFLLMGYLSLIRNDSVTLMHGLGSYGKEGLTFAWYLSLENLADFYWCFRLALLQTVLLLFPLSINFFIFMHGFFFCYLKKNRQGSLDQPIC